MRLDLGNLPSDVGLLHRLVRDMAAVVETRDDEIERLQRIIKQLQRGLCLLFIPSALATKGSCISWLYAYALFALTDIGWESKDFCGGRN